MSTPDGAPDAGTVKRLFGLLAMQNPDKLMESIATLTAERDAARRALRMSRDDFERIRNTRFGYDGDCGTLAVACNAIDRIDAAMPPSAGKKEGR